MFRLVLLRHGESQWNCEKRSPLARRPLSEKGRGEAREAGRRLKAAAFEFDLAFTSPPACDRDALITLEEMEPMWIPEVDWRLNSGTTAR
jgi:2,3-bisphosphoglycerate-dependent phosphoglycerate mutase